MKKKRTINLKERIQTAKSVLKADLPAALSGQCHPLAVLGAIMLVISLGMLTSKTYRGAAPFGLMLSVLMLGASYLRKREMVINGYDERIFKTLDYTYTLPLQKKPTGLLLIEPETNDVFHVAVTNRGSVPPLDWNLKVYIPTDATVTQFNGRYYFNKVFGYSVETEQTKQNAL